VFLGLHVKCPKYLPNVKVPVFLTYIKKGPYRNFTKIHPEEVMLICVNRQIDGHEKSEMCFS
jgi:hypothetical protein